MKWRRALLRIVLFACFGLLIEVFFTAAFELSKGNWNMHGYSSPWMTVVYGLLGVLGAPVSAQLKARQIPFLLRAFIYMVLIFMVEYLYGVLFQAVGLQIWNYSSYRLNLHGHITLLYAPFWFFLGLWVEYLYKILDACAVVIATGCSAEEIMSKQNLVNKNSQPLEP